MTTQNVHKGELAIERAIYSPQAPDPALRYVRFPATDDAVLSALLFTPAQPTGKAFILVPGLNGGILGGRHDYRPLARRLAEAGIALFLLNMRSSNEFAHSRVADIPADIGGAVAWLKSEGYDQLALFGTSLGGPRVMYYLDRTGGDPAIRMMGFIASIRSPYRTMPDGPARDYIPELDTVLARARSAVAEGRPREGITFDHFLPNRPQTMSARAFLEWFGTPGDTDLSTVDFGHNVRVPTLVVHGTMDEVANPSNGRDIYASLVNAPERKLVIVEGADHYLRAGWISCAYAEVVGAWVEEQFARLAAEAAE